MTVLLVTGFVIVTVVGSIWLVAAAAPFLILNAHRATEAGVDQAPLAHGLLDELAAGARVARPRLYVLPQANPNGFVVASERNRAVAVTEGVFDHLNGEQLRGLLALLVARVGRPVARAETAIAALALVLSPLILPSIALAHFGLPGRRWYEVDRSAASLVGGLTVASALEELEEARAGAGDARASAVPAIFCVQPRGPKRSLGAALATHPPTPDRIARIAEITASPQNGAAAPRARSPG